MSDRYPHTRVLDYCFHPIHLVDDNKDLFVPCGKCDGCLLHKANEWSMRVGMEIEATPNTIFFTLTYNNKYLPKLWNYQDVGDVHYLTADNSLNVRFNGKQDVLRKEDFSVFSCRDFPIIQSFGRNDYTCYSSKRDVILWLKLLRKDLSVNLYGNNDRKGENGYFRYFIISEYGPTTYRSHLHGLIFPKNKDIAEYLTEYGLYQNWKMCDKDLFRKYTHYCDSGARGYVTQYLTQFSSLPSLYTSNKEIKPFRLSSKSPSIGYVEQSDEKIYEDVSIGVTEYSRNISRLGTKVVLNYPKNYLNTLFVKCKGYSRLSYDRLRFVYSKVYWLVRFGRYGIAEAFDIVSSSSESLMDYYAARKCFKYCLLYNTTPESYLYLLDMYFYKSAMAALRMQYEYMESFCQSMSDSFNYDLVIAFLRSFYVNCSVFLKSNRSNFGNYDYVSTLFLEGYRLYDIDIVIRDLDNMAVSSDNTYIREVESICAEMVKVSKFNELTGNAPHIV